MYTWAFKGCLGSWSVAYLDRIVQGAWYRWEVSSYARNAPLSVVGKAEGRKEDLGP